MSDNTVTFPDSHKFSGSLDIKTPLDQANFIKKFFAQEGDSRESIEGKYEEVLGYTEGATSDEICDPRFCLSDYRLLRRLLGNLLLLSGREILKRDAYCFEQGHSVTCIFKRAEDWRLYWLREGVINNVIPLSQFEYEVTQAIVFGTAVELSKKYNSGRLNTYEAGKLVVTGNEFDTYLNFKKELESVRGRFLPAEFIPYSEYFGYEDKSWSYGVSHNLLHSLDGLSNSSEDELLFKNNSKIKRLRKVSVWNGWKTFFKALALGVCKSLD